MGRLIPTGGFARVYREHVGMSEDWENKEMKGMRPDLKNVRMEVWLRNSDLTHVSSGTWK